MNHETAKEAADLLVQAERLNNAQGQTVFAQRKVMALVIRAMVIVLGELTLIGCSGISRTYNYADAGEQWSSDGEVPESTTSAAGTGGSTMSPTGGASTDAIAGASSSLATGGSGGSSASNTQSTLAIGGSTLEATGGASQYRDPGECPCPQNNGCNVASSGCNLPGTRGDEGSETFTCVVSPMRCAIASRPVFCFQC